MPIHILHSLHIRERDLLQQDHQRPDPGLLPIKEVVYFIYMKLTFPVVGQDAVAQPSDTQVHALRL